MGLQCFLYSSDGGSAETIRQALARLDIEAESCPEAAAAAERIARQPFQIVIVDWDNQPEAPLLLGAARERKSSERPITLAIVSDDPSVQKALQAGANSVLRKPILASQAEDTLKTARDLVRVRREPVASAAQPAAAAGDASLSQLRATLNQGRETSLRAGEFLQSAPVTPGGSFETESDVTSLEPPSQEPVDLLKDLEPMAASVAQQRPAPPPPPPPASNEPRGLEWYLKAKGINRQAPMAPAPTAAAPAPAPAKPELLGFDQTPSFSVPASPSSPASPPIGKQQPSSPLSSEQERQKEKELFDYMEQGGEPELAPRPFRLGKGSIFVALVLAAAAVLATPQAPWHPQMKILWARGQRSLHAWLNPQPATPAQAPVSHESFGRPGDEYKLPTAEPIPDATTDPSQIQVLPVVDPTAKKPSPDPANPDPTTAQPTVVSAAPDATQPAGNSVPDATATGQTSVPANTGTSAAPAPGTVVPSPAPDNAPHVETTTTPAATGAPTSSKPAQPHPMTSANIPQSLKSQMAASSPPPANKPPEPSAPSIEPVVLAENVERALLLDAPSVPYPSSAKGQQGTVVLQVLIGRDGLVQDAKFLQGSLAFARPAIEGVRRWKFKPYTVGGRPVSVQTLVTLSFKP